MKYPIAFRIFAVLNLLLFFFLVLVCALTFADSHLFHPLMGYANLFVTIWVVISTVAWMFASKNSYHFLYSTGIAILVLCAIWMLAAFDLPPNKMFQTDKYAIAGVFGVALIYPIFLFGALFYAPIKDWTEKKFNSTHLGVFVLVLAISAGIMTGLRQMIIRSEVIYVDIVEYGGDYDDVVLISGNSFREYVLRTPVMINGFSIPLASGVEDAQISKYFLLSWVGSLPFDEKNTSKTVVEVIRETDQLLLKFPLSKMAAWQLRPCTKDGELLASDEPIYLSSVQPLYYYKMFEDREPLVFADESYDPEIDGESMGMYYDPMAGYNDRKLDQKTYYYLSGGFLNLMYSEEYFEYYYSETNITPIVFEEGSFDLGMYKNGLPYMVNSLKDAVKQFQGFVNYEYEDYVETLLGMMPYVEVAQNEDQLKHFRYMNPTLLKYAKNNLIPDPNNSELGSTYQEIYTLVFQRFARMLVLSHDHLTNTLDMKTEADKYVMASRVEEFWGSYYLKRMYSQNEDQLSLDGMGQDWSLNWEYIGFWLRRSVDETDDEMWSILKKVMQQYDQSWFDSRAVSELMPQDSVE